MAAVRVAPSIPAWEKHPEDFESLVSGLRERGLDAELDTPIPPAGGAPPVAAAGLDFAIYLAQGVGDAIIALLLGEIVHRVARARKRRDDEVPVVGVIYGPDGEILREVAFRPDDLDGE